MFSYRTRREEDKQLERETRASKASRYYKQLQHMDLKRVFFFFFQSRVRNSSIACKKN
jgi:hypothetical protein